MDDVEEVDHFRVFILSLSFFELLGFQIYLNAIAVCPEPNLRCVKDFEEGWSEGDERDMNWDAWVKSQTNWYMKPGFDFTQLEEDGYMQCTNSTGEGQCPKDYTCLKEYDVNLTFTPPITFWWGEFCLLLSKIPQFLVF